MSRFTSIPFDASGVICSSLFISGNLSFSPSALYTMPLPLKNFFNGRTLRSYQVLSSLALGFSSLIWWNWNMISLTSSHIRTFCQVVHFGYSTNSILMTSSHRCFPLSGHCWFPRPAKQAKNHFG